MTNRPSHRAIALLRAAFEDYAGNDFSVRLWDGSIWQAKPGCAGCFTLVLRHPGSLRRMLWPGNQLTISEAYLYDDFDIEGDIEALFEPADHFLAMQVSVMARLRYAKTLLSLPAGRRRPPLRPGPKLKGRRHSKERDRRAVSYHYDFSNEFYRLWLDRQMVYSCAYFSAPSDSLDKAQEQKLEHICRKLHLQAGQRLLDIGCGWGALLITACRRYGVEAVGVTLSQRQADYANASIDEVGLAGRCRVEVLDYRDIDDPSGYDRLVSVGMFEHVGEAMLAEYFRRAWRLLRPGGLFLNHGIAFSCPQPRRREPSFFDHYVFPDGELVPLSTTVRAAEAGGFEVRDVENLREHYRLTLQHWLARLEAQHQRILRITDEVAYRIWRLYLAAAAHQFAIGRTTVYQTLLSKPHKGESGLPLTRAAWYSVEGQSRYKFIGKEDRDDRNQRRGACSVYGQRVGAVSGIL
jgi:cyclopropane-fatty-acyl-phospholipid synthase